MPASASGPLDQDGLSRFVMQGDPALAAEIAATIPSPNLEMSGAGGLLLGSSAAHRLSALIRATGEYAWAVDPSRALRLFHLLDPSFEGLAVASRLAPEARDAGRAYLASAAAFAALQIGDFDLCLTLAARALAPDRIEAAGPFAGFIADTRYEALVRTFRIGEALQIRRDVLPHLANDPQRRVAEVDGMLEALVPLEAEALSARPQPRFDWFEETRDRLQAWVGRQRRTDRLVFESYAAVALGHERWPTLAALFDRAAAAVDAIEAVADDRSLAKADRDDAVQRGFNAHAGAMRQVVQPAVGRERTLHDNRKLVDDAAMVVGLKGPSRDEVAEAVRCARSARDWSARAGDRYGEAMALWALGCLMEREGRDADALDAFGAVFSMMAALRERLEGAAARGMLSGTFRTLVPRLARLALAAGDGRLAFDALEFRRGLAVSSRPPPARRTASATARAAYFAVSVFAEGIFASLATDDGVRSVEQVAIGGAELDALVARCRPDEWRDGILGRNRSPRAALKPILGLIERAMDSGRLPEGSQVCAALDHPLHAVPIHYLEIGSRLAGARLAFARCASFADHERLARAPPLAVERATAIFVPARDSDAVAPHAASYARTIDALAEATDAAIVRLEGAGADGAAVMAALGGPGLVHVQAHGLYPDAYPSEPVDPIAEAGLLVAAGGTLPDRSDPDGHMLMAGDMLRAGELLAGHVSLATCVSGLGRPGRAGDMLGVEFALRSAGVGSVVAAHWEVPHEIAADFFARFYAEWLGNGLGRGEAWRRAVAALAAGAPSVEAAAASVGAFSLFGEWS